MGSEQHLVWGHFCPSVEAKPFLALYAVPCEWWSFQLWLMRRALCEGLMLSPLMSTRCLVLSWDRVPFSQSDLPVRLLPTRPAPSFNSQRPPGFGWVFHPRFLMVCRVFHNMDISFNYFQCGTHLSSFQCVYITNDDNLIFWYREECIPCWKTNTFI